MGLSAAVAAAVGLAAAEALRLAAMIREEMEVIE